MKNTFPGYYRPTEDEYERLWGDALFAFDANVLLDFYRSTEETQNSFLAVLDRVKDRLWLPYQAAKEFHERKLDVVWAAQHAYVELRSAVESAISKFQSTLDSYRKHPRIDADELLKIFQTARDKVAEALEQNENKHPDVLHQDDIGDKLASLFDGKVGKPFSKEELEKGNREAEARYRAQIPPGYKDHKKDGARKYGDAIMWFQLLEHAKEEQKPVIFVTGDVKDDWWHQHEGKIIGPRPELIQEMWEVAKVKFRMYRPTEFVKYAQKHLNVKGGGSLDRAVNELNEIEKDKRSEEAQTLYRKVERIQKILGRADWQPTEGEEFWLDLRPIQAEGVKAQDLGPNVLRYLQSVLHEIPLVRQAIMAGGKRLVGFGPWPCECGRLVAALGEFSLGPTMMGGYAITCKCGHRHDLPAKPYKAFYFEDEWREL